MEWSRGSRDGTPLRLHPGFVIDASGPAGFLARQLSIASGVERTTTRSALVGSHFRDMTLMRDVVPGMPDGPYPDDWAAVHHVIDEGWMYSLRFDHGVTSAGFLLTPRGMSGLRTSGDVDANAIWNAVLKRYPTLSAVFADATPVRPLSFHATVQHRLTRSAGERWALLPHAYAFVDPLFSTGMAWSLRAVERLALAFESAAHGRRIPDAHVLERYDSALGAEADQIDEMIAGAYEAMAHFDLLAAHAMLYFATVSFAEVSQRLAPDESGQEAGPSLRSGRQSGAWSGFLGVGDDVLVPLPTEALRRLRSITLGRGDAGTPEQRQEFVEWMGRAIAPRNIAGLANPARSNLYPVDFDALVDQHALLGMDRAGMLDALPRLRGMAPEPAFTWSG